MEYRPGNIVIAGLELEPSVYASTVGRYTRPAHLVRLCMSSLASGDYTPAELLAVFREVERGNCLEPSEAWPRFVDALEALVLQLSASRAGLQRLADLLEVPHV